MLLGAKHVERLSLEGLRQSGAFFELRPLSYGGAFLRVSEDPIDNQSERITDLVSTARAVLAPIVVDVSTIKT